MYLKLGFLALLLSCCSEVSAQGVLTTFVGTDWIFPGNGRSAIDAPLGRVTGVAVDPAGNPVLIDRDNCIAARVEKDGALTALAGNGVCGLSFIVSGNGGPAGSGAITYPWSAAFDPAGNLYILGTYNVRKVSAGIIGPFVGSSQAQVGFSGDGGPATAAVMNSLGGAASDAAGNMYFADTSHRIRRVSKNGIIDTVAGTGASGSSGDGGPARNAALSNPHGIAFDAAGNMYIADSGNSKVRKVDSAGVISTFLSNINAQSVAFDSSGALFIGGISSVYKLSPGTTTPVLFAGSSGTGFSGDGGPATQAKFAGDLGVAPDNFGNLYISDAGNSRLRKVDAKGIVTTIAGNGNYRSTPENTPAVSATPNYPFGLAISPQGDLYYSERNAHRVRKVSRGIVTTVAGSGTQGFAGDGGPADKASLNLPSGLTFDTAGNLFIADNINGRVRKVTPTGTISTFVQTASPAGMVFDPAGNLYVATAHQIVKVDPKGVITPVAGTGVQGYSGDGGPALSAMLTSPLSLALDAAGNLYLAEPNLSRVRRITPQGTISTFAGTGVSGSSGDGGPANAARLGFPSALRIDSAGNLYISGHTEGHIRKVTPAGIISTIAGGGPSNQLGDGKVATSATLEIPNELDFDAAGNLYIADEKTNRIRVVLAAPPSIQIPQTSLSFSGASGGAPLTQTLPVTGSIAGLDFQASVQTSGGGRWLSLDLASGSTPRLISVTADPATLAPGTYTAVITITPAAATPAQLKVDVTFEVGPSLPPQLTLDRTDLSFTFSRGAPPRSSAVNVGNAGGGSLNFTVSASLNNGVAALSISPSSGTAAPGKPVPVSITVDPSSLAPGAYAGTVRFQPASGEPLTIPVIVTVSNASQALLLTQAGLGFTAVSRGGVIPSQSFGVVNVGSGALNWTASTSTLTGGSSWLRATPSSGASDAVTTPQVNVAVNAANLPPGNYYGQVRIDAPGAANTPQVVTVALEVLPADADPGASVQPRELVFAATPGNGPPGAQFLSVFNIGATPKSFTLGPTSGVGVLVLPVQGVIDPNQPSRLLVQPTGDFAAGSRTGSLTFQFSDGRVQTVKLTVVSSAVNATAAARDGRREAGGCNPTTLLPSITTLGQSFMVSANWPMAITADVRDDCGTPHTAGSVSVNFSNGSTPLSLVSLRDGTWQGTWQAGGGSLSNVSLKVTAVNPELNITGTREIAGAFRTEMNPPSITAGSVGSAAGFVAYAPQAPGGIISIYGTRLADDAASNAAIPVPTRLGSTEVVIGGVSVPLFYVSPGQINALIPSGITPNTIHQVLVLRGDTYSQPVPVNVGPANPAPFLSGANPIAIAYRGAAPGFLVTSSSAATAGDVLVIYCAGLGPTTQKVADGAPSPGSPLAETKDPVTVSIGGKASTAQFAGLTPGFVGLYQVHTTVPAGLPPGEAAFTLSVSGQTSPASVLPIQ